MRQKWNHRCVFAFQVEERKMVEYAQINEPAIQTEEPSNISEEFIKRSYDWAAEPHTGLLSSWTALCFSSLHPWPWKCSCVLWETRRMGVAKDYVCDLILISQQEYVCVCMCLWVHMHQSSTNPIREMLHGNGPQRDTVMCTHVSSVFVCVEKGSETKTETVCICVHVWVFWAICVHCTGRPWAGSALEWGSASHLTFVCTRCLLNRRNRCTMCV